jgi:hypothetical protein
LCGTSGGWDAGVLAPLTELNEQLLELLSIEPADVRAQPLIALAAELRALAPPMRTNLARCSYLLIDAGFAQPERWQSSPMRVMDAAPVRGYFASPDGRTLVRRSLLFAWHLACTNRVMARVVLGMSGACAERLAQYRLRELEWLAELSPPWIRPRWDGQLCVWRRLIVAARRDNQLLLRQLQWHGLTLVAASAGQRQGLLC